MKYRLAIDNRVAVRVKGKIPGATRGAHTNFDFTLDMERLSQTQVNEAVQSGESIADFIVARTRGWDGQRLILGDDDKPAAFSEDALRAMLDSVTGMAVWIWQAYIRDVGVQEKN